MLYMTVHRLASQEEMKHLNHSFEVSESVEPLLRNRDPNMRQEEHVYAICCRPKVAYDVISGRNVKTIEGYVLLNAEAASFSSFRENQNQPFA